MRKSSLYLLAAAVSSFMVPSCERAEPWDSVESGTFQTYPLEITAESSVTKTYFGTLEDGYYPVLWDITRQAAFSLERAALVSALPEPSSDCLTATFVPEFATSPTAGDVIYGFSPRGTFDSKNSIYVGGFTGVKNDMSCAYLVVPSKQTPLKSSVDPSAQLIFGKTEYDPSEPVSMHFSHALAYGKMTITGFEGIIKSVRLTFPESVAGNSVKYDWDETFYDADSRSITVDPANVEDNLFWFSLLPTEGNAGIMKISVTDDNGDSYTKVLDLSKKALPFTRGHVSKFSVSFKNIEPDSDELILPWTWDGGSSSDFLSIEGVSAENLGSDYAPNNAPYLIKFSSTGAYVVFHVDSPVDKLDINVKMLGGNGASNLTVFGSSDGNSYSQVQKFSVSGDQNSSHEFITTNSFDISYRFIKVAYSKVSYSGSNIGLGAVSITKRELHPSISAEDISGVSPEGISEELAEFVATDISGGVVVADISGCVAQASVEDNYVVYDISPNYTGAARTGTIVLQSADNPSVTEIINVSQLPDVFSVSKGAVSLEGTAGSTATFTVTSSFPFNIVNDYGSKISVDPDHADSGVQSMVITVAALSNNPSADSVLDIGDITVIRNTDSSDPNRTATVSVTQQKGPVIVTPSVTVTTGSASQIGSSAATISGSYSDASSQPYELRFEYGTSSSSLVNTAYWNDAIPGLAGSFSVAISSLSPSTTYYYRAVVQVGTQDFFGEVLSFQTAESEPTPTGLGWLELPEITGSEDFVGHFYSTGTTGVGQNRNYTYAYDYEMYAAPWVAYPLCKNHTVSSIDPKKSWKYNPAIDSKYQVNIVSASYPSNYGEDDYARGHQIPNADRLNNLDMNNQTYYATNQTPQLQNKFNASVWSSLEGSIRDVVNASATDTVYVVTGAAFRKVGGNETITYLTAAKSGVTPASLPVPNYYWKVLLKVKRSGNTVTSARAIGVWMPHREYEKSETWSSYTVSVDQIEQWTGYNFFVNLPEGIENTCETNTSWSSFSSF